MISDNEDGDDDDGGVDQMTMMMTDCDRSAGYGF